MVKDSKYLHVTGMYSLFKNKYQKSSKVLITDVVDFMNCLSKYGSILLHGRNLYKWFKYCIEYFPQEYTHVKLGGKNHFLSPVEEVPDCHPAVAAAIKAGRDCTECNQG